MQTRGNLNDQRALQTRAKVKASAYKFQDTFINGDVSVDTKSLRWAEEAPHRRARSSPPPPTAWARSPAVRTSSTPSTPCSRPSPAAPTWSTRTAAIQAKILSAGRRIGGVEMVRDDIGGKRAVMWNGVPIIDIGTTAAGAQIIPMTETQGSSSVTGSMYAVKFGQDEGDQAVTGLTNGGVQVMDLGQLQEKPAYRTRIEFYCGLATFGGRAAARLKGVLAA